VIIRRKEKGKVRRVLAMSFKTEEAMYDRGGRVPTFTGEKANFGRPNELGFYTKTILENSG
jgi:hypothetical protein